jgi:hypothetical protein
LIRFFISTIVFVSVVFLTLTACDSKTRTRDNLSKADPNVTFSLSLTHVDNEQIMYTTNIIGKWYLFGFFSKDIGDSLFFQRDSCSFTIQSRVDNTEVSSTHTNSWVVQANGILVQTAKTKSTFGIKDVWGTGNIKWSINTNTLFTGNKRYQIVRLNNQELVLIRTK